MTLEKLQSNKAFGGSLTKYKFASKFLGGLDTQFNIFVPASASSSSPVPSLYYLAGLTCNEDTAAWKSGIIGFASKHSIAVVFPDTSPRGAGIEGEESDWDFGTGAGFYLDATSEKYKKHYNMYSLLTIELPDMIEKEGLGIDRKRTSLIGHSMGGHGALSIYLKSKPGTYQSASGFAPICNPTQCPWGDKAFGGYLADPAKEGPAYDSTHLLDNTALEKDSIKILVDYGTGDDFYKKGQLLPENLEKKARSLGLGEDQVKVRSNEGYDHSYYTVSSFCEEHVEFHAKALGV